MIPLKILQLEILMKLFYLFALVLLLFWVLMFIFKKKGLSFVGIFKIFKVMGICIVNQVEYVL